MQSNHQAAVARISFNVWICKLCSRYVGTTLFCCRRKKLQPFKVWSWGRRARFRSLWSSSRFVISSTRAARITSNRWRGHSSSLADTSLVKHIFQLHITDPYLRFHTSYRGLQAGGEQKRGGGLGDPPQPGPVPPVHPGVGCGQRMLGQSLGPQ